MTKGRNAELLISNLVCIQDQTLNQTFQLKVSHLSKMCFFAKIALNFQLSGLRPVLGTINMLFIKSGNVSVASKNMATVLIRKDLSGDWNQDVGQ